MFNQRTQANTATNAVAVPTLMAANLFFNVIANASFKVSATSPNWRSFLTWQVIGNLAGFHCADPDRAAALYPIARRLPCHRRPGRDRRLGFDVVPRPLGRLGRFGEFWENLYA